MNASVGYAMPDVDAVVVRVLPEPDDANDGERQSHSVR